MRYQLIIFSLIAISGCATTLEENVIFNIETFEIDQNKTSNINKVKSYKNLISEYSDLDECVAQDDCPFSQGEVNYIKANNKDKKLTGLALSGGGTRSASFSIGILKALHDYGKLGDIDVISGVSGGSYAAYWYFSQNFYVDKVNKYLNSTNKQPPNCYKNNDIFRAKDEFLLEVNKPLSSMDSANCYRFQKALEESSRIMDFRHSDDITASMQNGLELTTQLFIQGLSTPIHWITNGLFDWELNGMPFFYYYKDGLDRTYGYVPLDYTMKHFANAKPETIFRFIKNIDAYPIFMEDFKNYFEEKKDSNIPYFIINTTGVLDSEWNGSKFNKDGTNISTENRVFEFTPWGCHSVLLGKNKETGKPNQECKDFSAHAFKTKDLDIAKVVAISGAAVDGNTQPIDADGNADASNFWLNKFLDITHLNMGYHLDNPNNSTLHSAFHKFLPWPLYLLDDKFSDENSMSGIYLSDGGHSENLAVWPLIRRGVKKIYLVDAEQDQLSRFDSAKRLNKELNKYGYEMHFDQEYPVTVNNTNQSIFNATVKKNDGAVKANIIYIKLSSPSLISELKDQASVKLPYSVINYMKDHPRFPHESTADIFYSPEQFVAYRDLGYKLMLCHLDSKTCDQSEHYSDEIKPSDSFKDGLVEKQQETHN